MCPRARRFCIDSQGPGVSYIIPRIVKAAANRKVPSASACTRRTTPRVVTFGAREGLVPTRANWMIKQSISPVCKILGATAQSPPPPTSLAAVSNSKRSPSPFTESVIGSYSRRVRLRSIIAFTSDPLLAAEYTMYSYQPFLPNFRNCWTADDSIAPDSAEPASVLQSAAFGRDHHCSSQETGVMPLTLSS